MEKYKLIVKNRESNGQQNKKGKKLSPKSNKQQVLPNNNYVPSPYLTVDIN